MPYLFTAQWTNDMQPDSRFRNLDKSFWANVRTISQTLGYTQKNTEQLRVYSGSDMRLAMSKLGLTSQHLVNLDNSFTETGLLLHDYFVYRAHALNMYVEPRLMDVGRAARIFEELRLQFGVQDMPPLPMNKQKGEKKTHAYLTGIVNMIIHANAGGIHCDFDPRTLTTITRNSSPIRTLSRRVDGCFPSCTDPIAIWEIKEYYYTTTFGSRVADGVYESLLDGLELEEVREHTGIDVKHLLIIDSHFTWWKTGRSYLCRIIDMLNMGYLDEALFGYEVIERLPEIVQEWVAIAKARE